jgi:thioredoxin 1
MLRPVVSKVAEQVDTVDFYYVDQSSDLAQQFEVQSTPTLILVKNGEETKRSVGFIPEQQVTEFAES